jgi:hypothetical protein
LEVLTVALQRDRCFSEAAFRAFETTIGLACEDSRFRGEIADAALGLVLSSAPGPRAHYAAERHKKAKRVKWILKSVEAALCSRNRLYNAKQLAKRLKDSEDLLHAELFEVRLGEVAPHDAPAQMLRRLTTQWQPKGSLQDVIESAERFAKNAGDRLAREILERLRERCQKLLTPKATFHGLAPRARGRPADDATSYFAWRIMMAAMRATEGRRTGDEAAADVARLLRLTLRKLGYAAGVENIVEHLVERLYPPPRCGLDLRDWRELRGLSVAEAAKTLGVAREMIARAEHRAKAAIAPQLRDAIRRLRAAVGRRQALAARIQRNG